MESCSSRELALVREARSFRETRLLPYWSLGFAASHLRNGNLVEGVKCFLRAVRQFGIGTRMRMAPL